MSHTTELIQPFIFTYVFFRIFVLVASFGIFCYLFAACDSILGSNAFSMRRKRDTKTCPLQLEGTSSPCSADLAKRRAVGASRLTTTRRRHPREEQHKVGDTALEDSPRRRHANAWRTTHRSSQRNLMARLNRFESINTW